MTRKKNAGLAVQQQQQPPPPQFTKSQSGFESAPATSSSSGSLAAWQHGSEMDLHRLSFRSTIQGRSSGLPAIVCDTISTNNSAERATAPTTGLSLAYDLHVRKSKSFHALTSLAGRPLDIERSQPMGSLQYPALTRPPTVTAKTPRSNTPGLSVGYSKTSRPAPPPPLLGSFSGKQSLLLHSPSSGTPSKKIQDVADHILSKPLPPAPPRTISRSYSSNLLRPTASSLARMQATIPPPSRQGVTPTVAKPCTMPSLQNTPSFSRLGATSSAVGLPTPRTTTLHSTATPSKKFAHLVPKSPHRRAMERHTAAGRTMGTPGGATGGLKSKTSQARLAMGHKQREIEERRRARLEGGKMVF
ncbi:hypothetical protein QFC19_009189 [Naganishia cerealis]|uniref:Uncharacterized protein n=1 Tax=Naganishia cerealis TaxID=610337 RepID=A0ACC2UVX8_9TREE|nr:hypothetical protein QFC19_009189 [Naganishia cerealis]